MPAAYWKEKSARALCAVTDFIPQAVARFPDVPALRQRSDDSIGAHRCDLDYDSHFSHTSIGIAALEAGLHVLVEKPISVHKADCEG